MINIAKTYKLLSLCFHHPEDPGLQKEFTRLFSLTVAGGIPPYETEYGHKDIFFKTQRLADIAGFYRAFGFEISDTVQERVDFIGVELEFMYWLTHKEEIAKGQGKSEEASICRDAAAKFLQDHLGRWASYFVDQIAKASQDPFYSRIGRWLGRFVESECRRLGVTPERVTGWNPEPISATDFECGPGEAPSGSACGGGDARSPYDDESQSPQPLTITK